MVIKREMSEEGAQAGEGERASLFVTSSRLYDAYRGGSDDRRGEAGEDIYDFCAAWVGRLVEIAMGGDGVGGGGGRGGGEVEAGDYSYAARLAREVADARGAPKELTRLPFEFGSKKATYKTTAATGRGLRSGRKRSRPKRDEVRLVVEPGVRVNSETLTRHHL